MILNIVKYLGDEVAMIKNIYFKIIIWIIYFKQLLKIKNHFKESRSFWKKKIYGPLVYISSQFFSYF